MPVPVSKGPIYYPSEFSPHQRAPFERVDPATLTGDQARVMLDAIQTILEHTEAEMFALADQLWDIRWMALCSEDDSQTIAMIAGWA